MNIAFVPVRGGSKSIPQKNIKKICGKPLLCYTVDAALKSNKLDAIYIATDAIYIEDVIKKYYGSEPRVKIYNREPVNAKDDSSTESVMLEFANKFDFETIVLLQVTSPLTTSYDIDGAISKYYLTGATSLLSVVNQKRFLWEKSEENFVKPNNYDFNNRPRRQDFQGYFVENGAIYITSRNNLLISKSRLIEPVTYWEMDEKTYIELDEPSDWEILESILSNKKKNDYYNKEIKLFLTDVDGVLTDAGMYYTEKGDEFKKFNTRDGKAFELLRNNGILTGIITAEDTAIVKNRAKKIKVDYLFQGVEDKLKILNEICDLTGFKKEEVAYIGDDLNDVDIISNVGLSACPADAVDDVKACANLILKAKGGRGAVREFTEKILHELK